MPSPSASVEARTRTTVSPSAPSLVAEMIAVPLATAVTRPSGPTDATASLLVV
jgi:hypothetical protein